MISPNQFSLLECASPYCLLEKFQIFHTKINGCRPPGSIYLVLFSEYSAFHTHPSFPFSLSLLFDFLIRRGEPGGQPSGLPNSGHLSHEPVPRLFLCKIQSCSWLPHFKGFQMLYILKVTLLLLEPLALFLVNRYVITLHLWKSIRS